MLSYDLGALKICCRNSKQEHCRRIAPIPWSLLAFLLPRAVTVGTMQRAVGCASFARPAAALLLASTLMSKSHIAVTHVLCAAPTSGAKWSNGGALFQIRTAL
jgi:hypothetical protein